jgi:hypothetical protein
MTISTQTHHIETQHADGTQYQVFFRWIEKLEWSVSITNVETQQQDHGIFRKQYDGLFGIDGLEDGPEVGFPSEHIQMIQNEICQDLMAHGELQPLNDDIILKTTNQAAFETLLEALKWRVVRREKDRVIIERVNTGEQGEIKEVDDERK